MKEWKKRVLSMIPAFILMAVIFTFSAQPSVESNASSNYIVDRIIEISNQVEKAVGIENPEEVSLLPRTVLTFLVRKLAHTFEYAVFGVSLCFFWIQFHLKKSRFYLLTIFTGFLYACTDELHQYFVPGRSCEFRDVLIDTNGVFLGTLIFCLLLWHRKRKKCGQNL